MVYEWKLEIFFSTIESLGNPFLGLKN